MTSSISRVVGLATAYAGLMVVLRAPTLATVARCSLAPEQSLAVVRVERDTILPLGAVEVDPDAQIMSSTRIGAAVLATPGAPMPAARARLLSADSATRTILASAGITDSQPTVFLRAAPYGPDCRTLRWTDTAAFVFPGETAFTRLTMLARDEWVRGVPVFISRSAWYSSDTRRRRSFEFDVANSTTPAPVDAVFALEAILDRPREMLLRQSREAFQVDERARLARAMSWARANPIVAELAPVRTRLRDAVRNLDWEMARKTPSRLRGTYRVEIDANGTSHTWYFRTQPQLAYEWRGVDSMQTTREFLASPHIAGYSLVGYAADSIAKLNSVVVQPPNRSPLVWLYVADRPSAPGNDARTAMTGVLEFMLGATSESTWAMLEPFARVPSALEREMMVRMPRQIPRSEQQRRIPLTVHFDTNRGARADTTIVRDGRRLRVTLTRVDTVSVPRLF